MLHLEFKRAELALKAGRLEDVSVILGNVKVRQHRRGQVLIDELVASYIRRGQDHLDAGSVSAAREDVYTAIKWGGRQVDAVRLLERIKEQVSEQSNPTPVYPKSITTASALLHVDGLGCVMLLPQSKVTIGGAGRSQRAEINLQTEGIESPLSITRDGDDYFAAAATPVRINDRPVRRALLCDGDLIELGKRGRLRFQKPIAASGSAVLQLTGAGIQRRDVRQVVLLSDSLLFGAPGCHFKIESLGNPVLLSSTNGQLTLRRMGDNDSAVPLLVGQSQVIDDVRFGLGEFA